MFNYVSGIYSVELMLGTPESSKGILWKLGTIELNIPFKKPVEEVKQDTIIFHTLPELEYTLPLPERRPAALLSWIFTILVCVPFLLLIVGVSDDNEIDSIESTMIY
jgi:hypothetical protein